MSVRLPTVHQRTPTQSRCYILDNIHGGLTRTALVSGESLPACAWRFPLHARSPNHGGLTPAALASECERLPAKLRLLRCTNACAPGAGGVSPPWLAESHRQGSATFAMHERVCTRSGGCQPPAVRGTAPARECDFCDARTHMHQERGASAPRGSRNRTGKGVRLLRCTNAHAPGAGGVSPPWFTVTHVQRRGAIVRETSDRRTGERQRSHGTTTLTAG
jgi:hypothetical protein